MIRRHLEALFWSIQCDRDVLLPMLDKLEPKEQEALWHLLRRTKEVGREQGRQSLRAWQKRF